MVNHVFQIKAPHFTAGGVWNEKGLVERAAPIIKYMVGWSFVNVSIYCRQKNWTIEVYS